MLVPLALAFGRSGQLDLPAIGYAIAEHPPA